MSPSTFATSSSVKNGTNLDRHWVYVCYESKSIGRCDICTHQSYVQGFCTRFFVTFQHVRPSPKRSNSHKCLMCQGTRYTIAKSSKPIDPKPSSINYSLRTPRTTSPLYTVTSNVRPPWQLGHHKFPRQQIEHAPEDQRDERTAHDDHVIRHAEIRCGKVNEHRGGLHPSRAVPASACSIEHEGRVGVGERDEDGGWEIPSALGIWRVLGVA